MGFLFLCLYLTSLLSIMFLSFIHIIVSISNLFFYMLKSIQCTKPSHFINALTCPWALGCFQSLGIMKNAAIKY